MLEILTSNLKWKLNCHFMACHHAYIQSHKYTCTGNIYSICLLKTFAIFVISNLILNGTLLEKNDLKVA
jgi:hypothetical protein